MITITYEGILAGLAFFTAACVAGGWFIKIVKALKKPSDDVNEKLDRDNKRIAELENQYKYVSSAIGVLMRCDLVMLSHMRTNNNTGQMAKMEKEIQEFLIER